MTQTTTDPGIEIKKLDGTTIRLTAEALQAFRGAFRGPILRAGESGYEDARQVWNRDD